MEEQKLTQEFKEKIDEMLRKNDCKLPIVASIGKQSKGKSYFMGKLFGGDIPNKHNQFVEKGTDVFYIKTCKNFLLLDMEGLEGKEGTTERDMLNFAITYALSSIFILHISQEDLENSVFIESFSYYFWHASKLSLKFNPAKPKILLMIRDPRISEEKKETVLFYNRAVEKFEKKINEKILGYIKTFHDNTLNALSSPDTKKLETAVINQGVLHLLDEQKTRKFKIKKYFCIYYIESFKKGPKYYEMNKNFEITKMDFEIISNLIYEICSQYRPACMSPFFDPKNYFDVSYGISRRIHEKNSYEITRESMVECIYLEVNYNSFSHFRDFFGYLRFMESFYEIFIPIAKINSSLTVNVNENTSQNKIIEIRGLFKSDMGKIINGAFGYYEYAEYANKYIKYLTVFKFCKMFGIDPKHPNQSLYASVDSILSRNVRENTIAQVAKIWKEKKEYECFAYFDDEFRNMVSVLMKFRFKLYESLFEIYKEKIKKSLKTTPSELITRFDIVVCEKYEEPISQLLLLTGQSKNFSQIETYLNDLRDLQKLLIIQDIEKYYSGLKNSIIYPESR